MCKVVIESKVTDQRIGIKCTSPEEAEMKYGFICEEKFDTDVEIQLLGPNGRIVSSKSIKAE